MTYHSDPLRILVVDDDPIFRTLAVSKLKRLAHEVVDAPDGAIAWSRLVHETFHLALVDLDMPHLKGDDLIHCVRGHPHTRHLPVIVITSRNDAEAVRAALDAGATSFLTKPVNWSMFANHIEYLLRLNRVSDENRRAQEEARRTISAIADLVSRLSRDYANAAESISAAGRSALDVVGGPDASGPVAEAVQGLLVEAERARANLNSAVEALQRAAERNAGSGAVSATLLRAC